MDDVSWGILTLSLTAVGALVTWLAFKRWGAGAGLKALAFTLLPLAAYLTKTLEMFTRIADAVTDWATALVFSPQVWVGTSLAALSVVLYVVGGMVSARGKGRRVRSSGQDSTPATGGASERRSLPDPARKSSRKSAPADTPAADDDLSDVEAILRKRGIS